MRPLSKMETIQIELTNACVHDCANCTRLVGHFRKPFFLLEDQFKEAVDSLAGFPAIVGMMGGEPLLHPGFERFCEYIATKFPREQLGLWTCLPRGYEFYREIICATFGNIFINDHSRPDIFHCPVLVAAEEVIPNRDDMFIAVDSCWIQNNWSASINPKGAFFCEIAASMSLLFDGSPGWEVEPNWWKRTPKDFKEQIEEYCPKCGCALSLPRRRSIEEVDDISPGNIERLAGVSKKLKRGKYVISNLKTIDNPEPMGFYKDLYWRNLVANRYGMFLLNNKRNYCEPFLRKNPHEPIVSKESLFDLFKKNETERSAQGV